jgi:hypothetical protein
VNDGKRLIDSHQAGRSPTGAAVDMAGEIQLANPLKKYIL